MRVRYRCKRRLKSKDGKQCDARIVLAKRIDQYIRPPVCPNCGAPITYRDKEVKRRHKNETCYCHGYSHPHRKGSRYCDHNENLTEADWEERYRSL